MKQETELLQSVLRRLGIESLNAMQEKSLQAITGERDVVLLSPTGTGKTLAFLLPLLQLLKDDDDSVQVLILVPSRELALQIAAVFKSMGTPWKACCCYGGHPIAEEKRSISANPPAILIGTPGRIADHLRKGNFSPQTIRTLVVDEFDKSLELGFHDQMGEIISQLSGLTGRVLSSATDIKEMPEFAELRDPIVLNRLEEGEPEESRLRLLKVVSPSKDKIETLYRLLCVLGNDSSIVFCNHREATERVSKLLKEKGLCAGTFHGGMEQSEREQTLYKFRNGSCYALISTDLAARGLDIPEVGHIIHYHLPVDEEAFTHRNGRTARWDAKGASYLILNETESPPPYIKEDLPEFMFPGIIPQPAQTLWATLYIGKGKKDKLSRADIAGFLYKTGGLGKEDLGAIDVREHHAFATIRRNKLSRLLALVCGEKIKGMKTIVEEAE
ncbi:MAG: DEAD/DEAH box helicase [Mediterranea sp.]|jgi:superfamily II DNA/RNA helicase|nr:DEAD/DEAH box helicase [Mediterranea sp.]